MASRVSRKLFRSAADINNADPSHFTIITKTLANLGMEHILKGRPDAVSATQIYSLACLCLAEGGIKNPEKTFLDEVNHLYRFYG